MNRVVWPHKRSTLAGLLALAVVAAVLANWGRAGPALVAIIPPVQPLASPTSTPASAPASVAFEGPGHDVRLAYPACWLCRHSDDYVLQLFPPNAPAGAKPPDTTSIQFDIPDLPPHFPGMIKLGLIEHGYVSDLKKAHPGLHVEESTAQTVPNAKARLFRCTWEAAGHPHTDVALMMIHNDRVYILSADADGDAYPGVRAAFDEMAKSIKWEK